MKLVQKKQQEQVKEMSMQKLQAEFEKLQQRHRESGRFKEEKRVIGNEETTVVGTVVVEIVVKVKEPATGKEKPMLKEDEADQQ